MKKMLVSTDEYVFEDTITKSSWMKCKRCKNTFQIWSQNYYSRTILFCPFCGQTEKAKKKTFTPDDD